MSAYHALEQTVNAIRLIDTHQHLAPSEAERLGMDPDPLAVCLACYSATDAHAAGLSLKDLAIIQNPQAKSLKERWEMYRPIWPFVKTTGYGRALLYALRDLYGIEDLSAETLEPLSERLRARNIPGIYRWTLYEKSGIDLCLRTPYGDEPPPELPMVNVMNIDHLIDFTSIEGLETLSEQTDVAIHRLCDLEEAVERRLAEYATRNIVGLKLGLAYMRSLRFAHVTAHEAEQSLALLFATPRRPIWGPYSRSFDEMRPLQDYLLHRVVQCAEALDLPLQIHAGFQEGYGNTIANADPSLLTNLLIEYPRVKFVIFHLAYPYTDELTVMAKTFQNVYVDFCFNHICHPTLARRVLGEMLDTIPANKLMAFGGDHSTVEGTYGHQVLARRNVAAALAAKVDEGYFSVEEAEFLAHRLLRDNALELYRLQPFLEAVSLAWGVPE